MANQPLVVRASTMPAVTECQIGPLTVPSVDARTLHAFLGCRKDFATWIRDRLRQFSFENGKDYTPVLGNRSDGRKGKPRIEYAITLDMAKELAMVERNEQGKRARQYFIECERQVLATAAAHPQQPAIPQTLPEALRLAADLAEKNDALQARVKEDEPKVLFHDAVTEATNCQTILEAAKVLGTGQRRLFQWLRDNRMLTLNNLPYQTYVDQGYFKVIQKEFTNYRTGEVFINGQTVVTGKGMVFLQRKLHTDRTLSCNAA